MFRMTFRILILLILVPVFTVTALAQSRSPNPSSLAAQVHGQVRYAAGGRPAEFVIVRLEYFRGGVVGQVITDRTGKFAFSGLNPDQYIVTAHAPGFKEAQQTIDLQTSTSGYAMLQLVSSESNTSSEAAVTGPPVDASVPAEARKEFEKGLVALLEKKDLKKGLSHLEKAVKIDPNFLEAQLLLGTGYMDAQAWDKAERTLRRALEINPKTTEALLALGEVYQRQGKLAEAEQSLIEGLKLNDNAWQGHLALGKTYWAMGDANKAAPHARRALELRPDAPPVHLLMGNVLLRQRDATGALVEFETYLKQDPNGSFAPQTREMVKKIRQALGLPNG